MSQAFDQDRVWIDAVLHFDAFYFGRLESIRRACLNEGFTATDLRVIHRLSEMPGEKASAAWLNGQLRLDKSYLCRVLHKLEECGVLTIEPCPEDRRHRHYTLTRYGRDFIAACIREESSRVRKLLQPMGLRQKRRLAAAMKVVEEILTRDPLDHLIDQGLSPARRRARSRGYSARLRNP